MRLPLFLFLTLNFWTAQAAPPPPSEPALDPAALRADFVDMYSKLKAAHFDLYAFTPKAQLDADFTRSLSEIKRPMSPFEAKVFFQLFAAKVHMGHTRVDSPMPEWRRFRKEGGKGFPLQIRILDGAVYVADNLSGVAGIASGDQIVSLDGETMASWLARTERHVSAEAPRMAHSILEYDFAMYLWVESGARDDFALELKRGGTSVKVNVPARTAAEMQAAQREQPPSLNLEEPPREARMIGQVAYLRPGPFYNAEAKSGADQWDVSGFKAFIDAAFEKFLTAHATRLVIDLRGNPGGDNLFSDVMVAWFATQPFKFAKDFKVKVSEESIAANAARIAEDAAAAGPVSQQYAKLYAESRLGEVVDFPLRLSLPREGQRFTGKVFVLIDRQSYSNAVSVAALVQDYQFGQIIGEATADLATTYGAMEQFTLPRTDLHVGYPKAHIVRPNGDARARGVTPDIAIRIPIVRSPSDEVLTQAIAIARR